MMPAANLAHAAACFEQRWAAALLPENALERQFVRRASTTGVGSAS